MAIQCQMFIEALQLQSFAVSFLGSCSFGFVLVLTEIIIFYRPAGMLF